jgi:hypothetical protein
MVERVTRQLIEKVIDAISIIVTQERRLTYASYALAMLRLGTGR